MQRDKYDIDFRDLHDSIDPSDIRATDRILARIRLREHASEYIEVQVWRLSPLGIELVYPEIAGLVFEKGNAVDLELVIAGQRSSLSGLVVDFDKANANIRLIGIRLSPVEEPDKAGDNRRGGSRWICSDQFYPTCISATPGKFDDYMYFQVRDVSSTGVQLMCSLRNKFLVPSMRLSLTVVFPMGNMVMIPVEIVRVGVVSLGGRDRLIVGAKFATLTEQAKRAIGQYLIQFSANATAEELREAGLVPNSVALGVDFYNLKSEADYQGVLRLRYESHLKDGNIDESVAVEEMGDLDDLRARIIVGKFQGQIIATARIRFNESDEPLEHEKHIEWPRELPRRDQIVEVSRVATDKRFRHSDLLAALFRVVYVNMLQPERPWIVISCLDHMVPFYKRMGFKETGLRHKEDLWVEDRMLNVLIVNCLDIVLGRDVDPFYWNYVWRDVADLLIGSGVVRANGLDRARLRLYKALGPIGKLWSLRKSPLKAK